MAKDMTSHQNDKTYLQVVNISTRNDVFDKITREARENGKKSRTTGSYSGLSLGGKNMNNSAQSQSAAHSSPYLAPFRQGQQSKGQAYLGHSSTSQSHLMKDCPRLRHAPEKAPATQAASTGNSLVAPPPVRAPNTHTERGSNRGGSRGGGRPARLYAYQDRQNAEASNKVITGILSVCGRVAYVLIDPGSSFSYVSPYFCVNFGKTPEQLGVPFEVSTPIGEYVKVEYIFRDCIITVQARETLAALNMLDMVDFDIISGMDCLSSCHAIIDYHMKTVKFSFIGEDLVIIKGEVCTPVGKFISYLKARKLVSNRCLAYLAHVRDMKAGSPMLESIHTVKDFPEVFPDDLPGISPDREIEFGIDTFPRTQPILIPPYRMAPAEVNELKKQLQDLLDKGFIRPSVSP
ncbi:uncharacterized protein [Nicotiana tomentosiformis]|uniref:uncharacterized protein n=1 Tax=Nicotiana tomentosiformis TaxID=4098 RepID=UPI00388C6F2F